MTYARSRLWLGITGVGSLVLLASLLLVTRFHEAVFPTAEVWHDEDLWSMCGFVGCFLLIMLPFDLLGGMILPNRRQQNSVTFVGFFGPWLIGVMLQSLLFVLTGLAILAIGRLLGLIGVLVFIVVLCFIYVALQGFLLRLTTGDVTAQPPEDRAKIIHELSRFRLVDRPLVVIEHSDPGFTGGIVGLPGREVIIVPSRWVEDLSTKQLSIAIARRLVAIQSKSRTHGLLLALAWVTAGFALSSMLPGAGVQSVAELITTCAGFTLWTFLGLLVLPTVSRSASYAIDGHLVRRGVSQELLESTIATLDRLQDDEPQRSKLVETIFHPVPSVANRRYPQEYESSGAWHAARTVLFLSWACLGLLSRAVHCNAGRPELWIMLPTD